MISMTMLLALAAVLPLAGVQYLARLPYAPECPQCRAITGQPGPQSPLDRLYGLVAATGIRQCGRCGWSGRMRWRLAGERARSDG